MLECFCWFVFKDSRTRLWFLKDNSTPILIINYALSAGLAIAFFIVVNYPAIFDNNIQRLIFVKFIWELVNSVLFMPFLVVKSFQKHVFRSRTLQDKHDLGLYVKSRMWDY